MPKDARTRRFAPISDSSRNLTTTDEYWPCSPTYERDGSALAIDASDTARPQTCASAASTASARCRFSRVGRSRRNVRFAPSDNTLVGPVCRVEEVPFLADPNLRGPMSEFARRYTRASRASSASSMCGKRTRARRTEPERRRVATNAWPRVDVRSGYREWGCPTPMIRAQFVHRTRQHEPSREPITTTEHAKPQIRADQVDGTGTVGTLCAELKPPCGNTMRVRSPPRAPAELDV